VYVIAVRPVHDQVGTHPFSARYDQARCVRSLINRHRTHFTELQTPDLITFHLPPSCLIMNDREDVPRPISPDPPPSSHPLSSLSARPPPDRSYTQTHPVRSSPSSRSLQLHLAPHPSILMVLLVVTSAPQPRPIQRCLTQPPLSSHETRPMDVRPLLLY